MSILSYWQVSITSDTWITAVRISHRLFGLEQSLEGKLESAKRK